MKRLLVFFLFLSPAFNDRVYAVNSLAGVLTAKLYKYRIPSNLDKIDCYSSNIGHPEAMHACEIKKKYCAEEFKSGENSCELIRMTLVTGYGFNYLLTDFINIRDFSPTMVAQKLNSQVGSLLPADFVTVEFRKIVKENFEYNEVLTAASVTQLHDAFPAIHCVSPVNDQGLFFFGYFAGYDADLLQHKKIFERLFRIDRCATTSRSSCTNFWGMVNATPRDGLVEGPSSSIDENSLRPPYYEKYGQQNYDFAAQQSSEIKVHFDNFIAADQLPLTTQKDVNEVKTFAKEISATNATLMWSDARKGKTSEQKLSGSVRLYCYRIYQR